MTALSPNPTDSCASLTEYQQSMSHRHFIHNQEAKMEKNTAHSSQSTTVFDVLTRLGQSEKDRFRRNNSIHRCKYARNASENAFRIDSESVHDQACVENLGGGPLRVDNDAFSASAGYRQKPSKSNRKCTDVGHKSIYTQARGFTLHT
jgi:hypothetical protein